MSVNQLMCSWLSPGFMWENLEKGAKLFRSDVFQFLQLFDDASGNGVVQITDRRCSKDFGSADHEGETFAFTKSLGVIRHGVPLSSSVF